MSRKIFNLPLPLVNAQHLRASALVLGVLLPSSLFTLPAVAVRLNNGQTFFDYPPRLLRATTSSVATCMSGATYYFTLSVPEHAGEPLQAVTVTQRENRDTVIFQPSESRAFAGNRSRRGPALSLASIGGSQPSNSQEETVVFDPPVPPGSTVTIALKPKRNPDWGGVYLFGVTAYPAGENSSGQFLGYGRLTFYDNAR